jgi:hypothetical protein
MIRTTRNMSSARIIGASLTLSVATLGCFGCSGPGGGGTTDAGLAGAGSDAGAPADAAPPPWVDASLDKETGTRLPHPSFQPWGPEWAVLPGMPETAAVRYAVDPQRALTPVTWKPCADGHAHCLEQVVDWTDLGPGDREERVRAWVYLIGGRPVLKEVRVAAQPQDDRFISFAGALSDPLSGEVLFAVAAAPFFASTFYASIGLEPGPNGVGVSSLTGSFATDARQWERHFDFAQRLGADARPLGAPQAKRAEVSGCPLPTVGGTGELSVSTFGAAMYFTPFGAETSTEVKYLDGTPVGGTAAWPANGGMTAWYRGAGGGLYFVDARGEWRWLILPRATATFGKAAYDATTDRLVWTEYDDAEPHTLRLYSAPWSLENASDARTELGSWDDRLYSYPWAGDLAAHDGLAVSIRGRGEATVVNLATKKRVVLRATPGETFVYSVWANAGEVWMATDDAGPGEEGPTSRGGGATGLKRFDVRPLFAAAP